MSNITLINKLGHIGSAKIKSWKHLQ